MRANVSSHIQAPSTPRPCSRPSWVGRERDASSSSALFTLFELLAAVDRSHGRRQEAACLPTPHTCYPTLDCGSGPLLGFCFRTPTNHLPSQDERTTTIPKARETIGESPGGFAAADRNCFQPDLGPAGAVCMPSRPCLCNATSQPHGLITEGLHCWGSIVGEVFFRLGTLHAANHFLGHVLSPRVAHMKPC